MATSGLLGGKIPVYDNGVLSHEQEISPTTSLDKFCIEFEFQTDPNYYVDFRQTYLNLKLKFVKRRGYENYKTIEKKSTKKKQKGIRRQRKRKRSKRLQFLSILL